MMAEDALWGLRQGGRRLERYVEEFLELANQLSWHHVSLGSNFEVVFPGPVQSSFISFVSYDSVDPVQPSSALSSRVASSALYSRAPSSAHSS
ncbi:vegetative cell wall gp1-like isoform X4 [Labeo rohita]|uniref:Vegetative cell wall gp1-like isoform X4 n=1 Tax=Labeo rohita TaxID=84645 RepID=A0A498LCS8_LABRO|nr:vegetative cell wall gp1-like isoform X4 [Labeo rohita]